MDALSTALRLAGSGLDAQSERLRVVSENIANAQSTGKTPGEDPYQRKTVSFSVELDSQSGAEAVSIARIGRDATAFPTEYMPGHEAADANGYVRMPNVNMLVEMADLREANRSYEANLQVFKQARELISMTIDLLRSNG